MRGDLDASPMTPDALWSDVCAVMRCEAGARAANGGRVLCDGAVRSATVFGSISLTAQFHTAPGPHRVFPVLGVGDGMVLAANASAFQLRGKQASLEAPALSSPLFSAAVWAAYS